MVNVLSGGAHAGRAIDVQDVLVIPLAATTFARGDRARRAACARAPPPSCGSAATPTALVADEGGLAAPLASNEEALEIATRGIERAGIEAALALDVAATQLGDGDGYRLEREDRHLDGAGAGRRDRGLGAPLSARLDRGSAGRGRLGRLAAGDRAGSAGDVQLLGDDLFATSPERLAHGIAAGVANAVLVKPNQAGTLSAAREALELAQREGYATVVSARSGDTEDAWLADLAVGWRSGQIKVGSTQRSERTAKWNRLLRIEAEWPGAVLAPWSVAQPRSSTV